MQWKVLLIFVVVMVMHCSTTTCTFNNGTQKAVTSDLHIVVPGTEVGSFIQPYAHVNITWNFLPVMNCSMDITGFLKHIWICHNRDVNKLPAIWKSNSAKLIEGLFYSCTNSAQQSKQHTNSVRWFLEGHIQLHAKEKCSHFHGLRTVCTKSAGIVKSFV